MLQSIDRRAERSKAADTAGSTGVTAQRAHPSNLARLHRQIGNRAVGQVLQQRGRRRDGAARPSPPVSAVSRQVTARPTQPEPAPLAAVEAHDPGTGFRTVTKPVGSTSQTRFTGLQGLSADPDVLILGHVSEPANVRAPQYRLAWTQTTTGWSGKAEWADTAYEGDNEGVYVKAGDYRKGFGRIPEFVHVSRAVARVAKDAEQEHIDDINRAADISIFDAEETLYRHVIGKTFTGDTRADVERRIRAAIDNNLTEPRLGSNQTTWLATYRRLYRKTLLRDQRGWHAWGGSATMVHDDPNYPNGYIVLNVATGPKMNVGQVPSTQLITY